MSKIVVSIVFHLQSERPLLAVPSVVVVLLVRVVGKVLDELPLCCRGRLGTSLRQRPRWRSTCRDGCISHLARWPRSACSHVGVAGGVDYHLRPHRLCAGLIRDAELVSIRFALNPRVMRSPSMMGSQTQVFSMSRTLHSSIILKRMYDTTWLSLK